MRPWGMVRFACMLVVAGSAAGCAHRMPYVWVDDLPEATPEPEVYFIRPGDQLSILVWNQPQLSGDLRVRGDGKTTVPLVGDVALAGLTTADAAAQISRRLNGLVVDPHVTVTVEEAQVATVTVVGEVRTPGSYPMQRGESVITLVAKAGGVTEFADLDAIYVVRRAPETVRVRFRYHDLRQGRGRALTFELRDGDIVVVE